jgi:hypothetical protein
METCWKHGRVVDVITGSCLECGGLPPEKPIVRFKSWPGYFLKEKSGIKSNTVRRLLHGEERLKKLKSWRESDPLFVEIENLETMERIQRRVKDVSFFEFEHIELCIISW